MDKEPMTLVGYNKVTNDLEFLKSTERPETVVALDEARQLGDLKERYPNVTPICVKITPEWIDNFDFSSYDYILDAIDDVKPKVHLIKKHFTKVISTGGGAKRIDPLQIKYSSIWETYNDKFIKKVREELKKQGFKKKFKVIYSSEAPLCVDKGSFEGVTASFGLMMASVTIQKIVKKLSLVKDSQS